MRAQGRCAGRSVLMGKKKRVKRGKRKKKAERDEVGISRHFRLSQKKRRKIKEENERRKERRKRR